MLRSTPAGEDTVTAAATRIGPSAAVDGREVDLYGDAERQGTDGARAEDDYDDNDGDEKPTDTAFLQLVAQAEEQAQLYINQVNRKSWSRVMRAFHQEHFVGSKYTTEDFRNRSKLFIPKTRSAVLKDLAAVSASLFGTIDAVSCMAGNEADQQQRASAAVVQELLNYRTDRGSGKASIPWFHVALGARQDSILAGICLSKQSWKLELRKEGSEDTEDEDGNKGKRDVWKPYIDRPDCQLVPSENFVIDPAADWTNPVQDAAFIVLKWPMRINEIRMKQRDPRQPWKKFTETTLKASGDQSRFDMAAIRRAREQGLDRFDETQTAQEFEVIWVYETFMRTAGEDWTFLSVGSKHLLTQPKPVRDVYPEQFGERPLTFGYGSFEAHRIFPMSPAESWQPLQMEANDLRNLTLDAVKQSVLPVAKVVRGKQVDLDTLKRRGQGTSIMVTSADDVTWDRPPDVPGSTQLLKQALDIDFDDIAGQQNYGTVDANNNLSKTLGGLKLAAGSANARQEFDIRIWIETWCEPTLAQLVRLEQFYESDPVILGLCGERAQLIEKYGVDRITNDLLENSVTLRVNIGLGSGDPQQRLAKFQSAIGVALPLLQLDPDFQNGKKQINSEAVMDEVFGAAGYRDGGKRFIKDGQPHQNPMQQPELDALAAKTAKDRASAKAAILNALANAAKVGLGQRELEDAFVNSQFQRSIAHMDQMGKARDLGHKHGQATHQLANPQAPDGVPGGGPPDGGSPDSGGGPPPEQAGGIVPGATDVGAGNAGVAPAQVGDHGVPGADAGQQLQQDQASEAANLAKATTPRKRKVTIAKRGPDGRASEFHIEE